MRYFSRRLTALVLVLALLSFNTSCDGAKTVIKYVKRAMPLLSAAGVDLSSAQEVINLMTQFETNPSAAILSATTIAFDRLVVKAQQIPEQGKRTVVLVILVAANIALQELANKWLDKELENPNDPRLGAPTTRASIRRFAVKSQWNCRATSNLGKYKAGQYMPMEMCKKYPENAVVETQ